MLLCEGAANRLRFHSLPAHKQYADTDEELFAELDRDNDSGLQTSDLVKPVRSEVGSWSEPVSGEEFMKILDLGWKTRLPRKQPNRSFHDESPIAR